MYCVCVCENRCCDLLEEPNAAQTLARCRIILSICGSLRSMRFEPGLSALCAPLNCVLFPQCLPLAHLPIE